jgi:hypothetical protein
MSLPFDANDAASRQRNFRFHGESPTWHEIFDILQRVTGKSYQVTYLPLDNALAMEAKAKEEKDDQQEMNASHRVVQGSEGTLLPKPYSNNLFPDIKPKGVEEVFKVASTDAANAEWYGF